MNELSANFAEPALLQGRAAGVGQPFTVGIADCEFRIADLKVQAISQFAFRNSK